jgi:glutamine phosphoribosylpyrophosphate amidotransferase
MCGVLGITISNFNEEDYDLVRNLFQQSMIRGKHATGVSYVKNNKVITIKEPICASAFMIKQNLNDWTNEDGNLYCIGHIRYSTSDLRYNQPMATDALAIAHNGIISQEPAETWLQTYGYAVETANDSELILRCLNAGNHPLNEFASSSMSVCTIDKNKKITAFRNEARPLYYYNNERMIVFTSTEDIAKRSNLTNVKKCAMFNVYNVSNFRLTVDELSSPDVEDLQ